jgi:uncharacterized protein (UPF0335 family)
MTKEQLKQAIELIEKAEKEHPHADGIEFISDTVRVIYIYYPDIDPSNVF